jgi:hypothetical protein
MYGILPCKDVDQIFQVPVNEWRAAWVGHCSSMWRQRFYMKTVGLTLGAAAARSLPETCRGSP